MKTITTLFAAAALIAAAPGAADARPIHHTARTAEPTSHVAGPDRFVTTAQYVQVQDGPDGTTLRMVAFTMNDGSAWLSPRPDCLGLRHTGCTHAWIKAAKHEFYS